MILLFLGLILWIAAHFYKRVLPAHRAALGDKGKGIVVLAIVASVVLMVLGYRAWDGTSYWGRTSAMTGINNLLMIAALYFTSPGPSKGAIFYKMRHPMLTGVVVFAIAHLLVNGDVPSLVLFGGLGIWALITIRIINAQEGAWTRPEPGPISGDVKLFVIALVIYAIIAGLHMLLGPNPFVA